MDNIEWHIGDVIRKLRIKRRWTQEKLGEKAGGLNKATVVAIERNSGDTKHSTIEAVAHALGFRNVGDLYAFLPRETQRPTGTAGDTFSETPTGTTPRDNKS